MDMCVSSRIAVNARPRSLALAQICTEWQQALTASLVHRKPTYDGSGKHVAIKNGWINI